MVDPNAIFQHSWYIGDSFACILYGIQLVFFFATIYFARTTWHKHRSGNRFFIIFSVVLLLLLTLQLAVNNVFGEIMWISNANYPGGSAAYVAVYGSVWYQTMGTAASVLMTVMSDALLIYRCYVVWQDWKIVVIPVILNIASLVLGILLCYYSGVPNSVFFAGLAAKMNLSFCCVAIGLNVAITTLICSRILYLSNTFRNVLGEEASHPYTSAVSIIIESALPYALSGIAYVITSGLNHPTAIFFSTIYIMFTAISPQMIILRVLMGRGWTKETTTALHTGTGTIRFAGDPSTFNPRESDGPSIAFCDISGVELHMKSYASPITDLTTMDRGHNQV